MLLKRTTSLLAMVILTLAAAGAFAAQAVTNIQVADYPDRVEITVRALHPLTLVTVSSPRGEYVGFEIGARCILPSKKVMIGTGGIYCVRYGSYTSNPPRTRIVATTTAPIDYSTKKSPDRCGAVITLWKHGQRQPRPNSVRPAKGSDSGDEAESAAEPGDAPVTGLVPAEQRVVETARVMQPPLPRPEPIQTALRAGENAASAHSQEPQPSRAAPVIRPLTMAQAASPTEKVWTPAVEPLKPQRIGRAIDAPKTDSRDIALDFVAADINDVLKALSKQTNTNIVCGPDVKGEVTVSLNRVSLEQALDYITKLAAVPYSKDGDTYLVGSARGASGDRGTKSEAVTIRYAKAEDIGKLLEAQVPGLKFTAGAAAGGEKEAAKGPTVLVLSGSPDTVETAKTIVAQVESSLEKDATERATEIYEIKYAKASELAAAVLELVPQVTITPGPSEGFDLKGPGAVTLSQNLGATVAAAAPTQAEPPRPRVLVVSGAPGDVTRAMDLLNKLDVRAPQIKIEAKVTDISLNAAKNLGVTWEWSTFGMSQGTRGLDELNKPDDVDVKLHHLPIDVTATLNAMISKGNATLLANPSIVALEGKQATFFVGDEIKYIIGIQQTPQGQNITTETANVGIQLRIVGDVSPNGDITLNLHPEVSVVSDLVKIGTGTGGNVETTAIVLPQIARRFTDSVVRVRDGETIVIGGLIRENEINNLRKIPLLGDLPILGGLFRNTERSKQRSEIVIFLTASLVKD